LKRIVTWTNAHAASGSPCRSNPRNPSDQSPWPHGLQRVALAITTVAGFSAWLSVHLNRFLLAICIF
jgi:hypothetical protein